MPRHVDSNQNGFALHGKGGPGGTVTNIAHKTAITGDGLRGAERLDQIIGQGKGVRPVAVVSTQGGEQGVR